MAAPKNKHEINQIRLELDGQLSEETLHSLRDEILNSILRCFDEYSSLDEDIYIDKIELNLGDIKEENFLEEVKIRIIYLLRQEFDKSLSGIKEIQKLSPPKRKEKRLYQNFMDYLALGYSGANKSELSALFEEISEVNIDKIAEIFSSSFITKSSKDRILYQVKFSLLDSYWLKTFTAVYKEIQKINLALVAAFREQLSMGYNFSGAQGVIKKLTFQYLFAQTPKQTSSQSYLEEIKKNSALLKPYGEKLSQPLEVILKKFDQTPESKVSVPISEEVTISKWETFAKQKFPVGFKLLDKTNTRLLGAIQKTKPAGFDETAIKKLLVQLALEALIAHDIVTSAHYLRFINQEIQRFQPFASGSIKELKEVIKSIQQDSNVTPQNQVTLDDIKEYIQSGRLGEFNLKELTQFLSSTSNRQKLKSIDQVLKLDVSASVLSTQLQRLKLLFTPQIFVEFIRLMDRKNWGKFKLEYQSMVLLDSVTKKLFSINLITEVFKTDQLTADFFAGKSKALKYVWDIIHAKSKLDQPTIIRQVIKELEKTPVTKDTKQLISNLESLVEGSPEEQKTTVFAEGTLLSQYMYFLKTGFWKNIELQPFQALQVILEDSLQPFINQLRKILSDRISWTRLIFQNPVETVFQIFSAVFESDPKFEEVTSAYKLYEQQPEYRRSISRLFELFIEYKIASLSEDVSFEVLLEDIQQELKPISNETTRDQENVAGIINALETTFSQESQNIDQQLDELLVGHSTEEIRMVLESIFLNQTWYLLSTTNQHIYSSAAIRNFISVENLRFIIKLSIQRIPFKLNELLTLIWSQIQQEPQSDILLLYEEKPFLKPLEEQQSELEESEDVPDEILQIILAIQKVPDLSSQDLVLISSKIKTSYPFFATTSALLWSLLQELKISKSLSLTSLKVLRSYLVLNDENLLKIQLKELLTEDVSPIEDQFTSVADFERGLLKIVSQKPFDWSIFQEKSETVIDRFLSQFSKQFTLTIERLLESKLVGTSLETSFTLTKQVQIDVSQLASLLKPIGQDSAFYQDIIKFIEEGIPEFKKLLDLKISVIRKLTETSTYTSTIIQALANNWFQKESKQLLIRHYIETFLKHGDQSYFSHLFQTDSLETEFINAMEQPQFNWSVFHLTSQTRILEFFGKHSKVLWKQVIDIFQLSLQKPEQLAAFLSTQNILTVDTQTAPVDFEELLEISLLSGSIKHRPFFESKKEFIEYFKVQLRKDTTILKSFERVDTISVINFMGELDEILRSRVQVLGQDKLPATADQLINSLIQLNPGESRRIKDFSLAFSLSHIQFDNQDFLEFLEKEIAEIVLPAEYILTETGTLDSKLDIYGSIAVLIRYFKFDEIAPGEPKPESLLIQTISKSPKKLVEELKKQVGLEILVPRMVQLISTSKIQWLVHTLIPEISNQVRFLTSFNIYTREAAERLVFQKIRFGQISDIETLVRGSDEAEVQLKIHAKIEDQLSPLKTGIKDRFILQYDSFQLLEHLFKTGRIPFWSSIRSVKDLDLYFETVIEWDIKKVNILVNNELKVATRINNFYGLVGVDLYFKIFEKLQKQAFYRFKTKIDELLTDTITRERNKDELQTHLLKELIGFHYLTSLTTDDEIDQKIHLIVKEFNISIGLGEVDDIETQTISTELNILPIFDSKEIEIAEAIIFLIQEQTLPWWFKSKVRSDRDWQTTIIDQLKPLESQGLQKVLHYILESQGSDSLVTLAHSFSEEEFLETVSVIQPNFVGFIESFRLILGETELKFPSNTWQGFIIRFITKTTAFSPGDFINRAIAFVSGTINLSRDKVISTILGQISKSEEPRYSPIQQFLLDYKHEDIDVKAQVSETGGISFKESLDFYMKTGVFKQNQKFSVTTRSQLASILSQMRSDQEIFQIINQNLSDERVRKRILDKESGLIIWSYIQHITPPFFQEILDHFNKIRRLFSKSSRSFSSQKFDKVFLTSIIEKSAETELRSIIKSTIKALQEIFQLSADSLDPYHIEDLGLDPGYFDLTINIKTDERPIKPKGVSEQISYDPGQSLKDHLLINTAGIVIFSPYLPRYFDLLEMTNSTQFKDVDSALRAVHLLNFIATGKNSAPEHELLLNKVLCGVPILHPLPMEIDISDKEREITEGMMKGAVLQNWDRMKNSSIEALREGFLVRVGYLSEKDKSWELKVEKKTLDILMESIPWSFSTVKLPWMEKMMNVEWP